MPKMRTEKDSLGKIKISANAPWGIYTQRVLSAYPQDNVPKVPETFLRMYIESKMIYATVNARFRKITQAQKRAIHKGGKALLKMPSPAFMEHFPIGQIQSWWGTSTNMMINEVLANKANSLLWWTYKKRAIDAHDHLNASQSSNDTFPGVGKLVIHTMFLWLIDTVYALEKTARKHARTWKSLKKVGRTHVQDAVVITAWDEFAAYARSLQKHRFQLQDAQKTMQELNFGGTATGSLQNITLAIRKELLREYSAFYKASFVQPKSYFEQNSSSADFAYVSHILVLLANTLIKIGNDLRLLSSGPLAWFGEYVLPAVQPGSSIMPGKINPSVIEAMTMVCAQVIGHDQAINVLTRQAQLQLQQFMPGIVFPLIESMEYMTAALRMFHDICFIGILPDKKRMRQLLEGSFASATDYSEKLWYDVIAQAVHTALKTGKTLHEVLGMQD